MTRADLGAYTLGQLIQRIIADQVAKAVDELRDELRGELARALSRTAPIAPAHLTTTAAAAYCGMATKTLRNHLSAGTGPRYAKHGALNAFYPEDLDDWLSTRVYPPPGSRRRLP